MTKAAPSVPGFDPIFTVAVVAGILHVSTPTVYSIIKSGDLPAITFSTRGGRGVVRVAAADLRQFIESHRTGAAG